MATDYLLEIECGPELEEIVQARLFLTASTGNIAADHSVTAYFATAEERDVAAAAFPDMQVRTSDRARADWLAHYQQSLEPMFIGEKFVVAPDVALIPRDTGRYALVIPQEQAFGTGSHESTALCIELLESLSLEGKLALDVGAGSGILALAMRRLGARKVIAFDNDLDAFAALRMNRTRNGIDGVAIFIGTVAALRRTRFDVVTMNILPDVIAAMLPHLTTAVLIVSGILTSSRDEFLATADGFRVMSERTKGEWWAAALTR